MSRFAAVLLTGLLATGCAAADPGRPASTTASGDAAAIVIEVRIADGSVRPVDARRDARVGEPVELVVDSDTEDEIHVHGTPEHTFRVAAAPAQRFQFTVAVPGRVEVELHRADRTVVTLLVRA
ncbi:hypothetical protein [Nocardia bovistercoris]|uniref:EfeO-type cupredoxin-like domain-containing protein n=1 Tax=Nocardia bovistercoris TaxID=2785916 RepID=A0A931N2I6_9NOCA|nr:hypothetical protein [Nocardia bovistercoris]MBH0776767.1 hypothetical protein [Nocardia bovistercoris]